eukprot:scaffold388118_cov11-Prasinocladus_malaysianus.AAC.1
MDENGMRGEKSKGENSRTLHKVVACEGIRSQNTVRKTRGIRAWHSLGPGCIEHGRETQLFYHRDSAI